MLLSMVMGYSSVEQFRELYKVATGMAAHKKWRRTLFSTPSAITHDAYPLWTGEAFQKRFAKPKPWPDAAALRAGFLCPDTYWRNIITLADAEAGGCDLFDVETKHMAETAQIRTVTLRSVR